ncbi:B-cell receptor CD22-like [Trichomycterus rosablanca]|uniref:B-cell receptor CD22-like n=1 Tax=Trichomycterus rosablanca TaxID=2290929 RepID=UPI002F359EEB
MEDGGRYQCAVGDHRSSAVTLNVGYPPKNVSVSVSPSGVIMEGSSVTLTCSSDAKPAASYHWYKGTDLKATRETFTIHKIRSDDGGEYKCRARNEHGDQNSTAVNIDVHYPPRSVSVSVSPSGEITEGSSVTLTCSAVSNPPVENYTWYKEQTYKGSGETLTVRNISSEDGGEYKCRTSYKNQFKSSGPVAVKVLYPPKRVSVSVSSSAEPDQSGLVNLTCSADADPPVESYVWYKEGGSSAVGSGQSYGARPGESYYCRAQNKLGEQTVAALFVTLNGGYSTTDCMAVGVGVGLCLVAAAFVGFFCWRRKMQMRQKDERDQKDADADAETYAALDPSSRSSNNEYGTLTTVRNQN